MVLRGFGGVTATASPSLKLRGGDNMKKGIKTGAFVVGIIGALMLCALVTLAAPAEAKRIVGNGTLYAEGSGAVLLYGTGNVTLEGVGKLLIAGEDFQISVEGDGKVWTFGCVKIYKGNGTVHVEGTDMFILAKVRDGKLSASGEGMAILRGCGEFETHKWPIQIVVTKPAKPNGR